MIDFTSYFNSIFLGSLRSLCDVEWQNQGWGGGGDSLKYVGFDEIIMEFMDACEVVLATPRKYRLSADQQIFIKKLFIMLDEYSSNEERPDDEKDIINDPKWHKIQAFAKELYKDLTCLE